MSKLLPFLVAAAGASTVSVGGVFMLKKGGGGTGSEGKSQEKKADQTSESLTLYETVDAFKTANGDKCVEDLFGKELNMNSAPSPSGPTEQTDYFGTNPTDEETGKKAEGCLIIHGKKESKDDKGKGTFTWSGSFKNQKKGFIIFGVAKAASPKKLDLSGITYLMEEGVESSPKGTIKHSKNSASNKSVNDAEQEFDKKFPKAKDGANVIKGDKDYWEFISGKTDLTKVCETNDCPTDAQVDKKVYKWKGDWKNEGEHKIGEWSGSLDWWKNLFDENSFDLSGKLNSFSGTGTSQKVTSAT